MVEPVETPQVARFLLVARELTEWRVPSLGVACTARTCGGKMRKFIFSGTVLSAVFGGWSTLQATRKGPRDWRTVLMWVSWALTLAVAIGTVKKNAETRELEH
jgi:hypothetical protein